MEQRDATQPEAAAEERDQERPSIIPPPKENEDKDLKRPGAAVGRVFDLTKPRRRVLDVRAVGGGSRGRPELGPCRLQCGGEARH